MNSKRVTYIALLGLTIALGLLSRSSLFSGTSPIHQYAGDTLWALAIFWAIAAIFPRSPTLHLVISALIISFSIEATQLYHAEWIDQLRSYRIGALILGFQFRWPDLLCYSAGIGLGAIINSHSLRTKKPYHLSIDN